MNDLILFALKEEAPHLFEYDIAGREVIVRLYEYMYGLLVH